MATAENKVLKPRDPSMRSEDDWPQIFLSNAEIVDSKHGQIANLLEADTKTPVTVTGRLGNLRKDQLHLLLNPSSTSPKIEISNVTRYAYGQFDDGAYAIWALGQAGWFEIRPGKSYKPMYDHMVEAVDLFYFLKDTHGSSDGEHHSAKKLFAMYAKDHSHRAKTPTAAAELMYKHRFFLAKAMAKEDREQKMSYWTTTPLHTHLKEKFPEMFITSPKPRPRTASVRSGSASVANGRTVRTRSVRSASQKDDNVDNVSTTSSRRRAAQLAMPTDDEIDARARMIWKQMLSFGGNLYNNGRTSQPQASTVAEFASNLWMAFNFETKDDAADYMMAIASRLINFMSETKQRNTNWHALSVYEELLSAKLPAVTRKKMLLHELKKLSRQEMADKVKVNADEDSSESSESDDSSEAVVEPNSPQRPKSVLRPKSGKFVDKGRRQRGKSYRQSVEATQENEGSEDDGIMEITSPSKRKGEDLDGDIRPRKRAASESRDIEDIASEDDLSAASALESEMRTQLPLRQKTEPPAPVLNGGRHTSRSEPPHMRNTRNHPRLPTPTSPPPIVTEELPTTEPNGPEEMWMCGVDGCTHKVYGAEKDLGKRLVKEHIAEHEQQRKSGEANNEDAAEEGAEADAIALVRMEEEMCHLPVSNLIKRIREMAEMKQQSPAFPASIQQRY
ncbi:hypothetical protein NA57DRAFT_70993 [Rhizodiscina lignyota]|uniref:DNA (cytosine-5)-methyltransferase 1 replication foci domain-containing protein n=1 Tax=Rhizodiscina lignyota TaxID=1504668 RepID=A0A9P4MET5_9PEZI|nr:hypothetical protein NA57DRAFT_70993 [Rhizodiscina lignyota]